MNILLLLLLLISMWFLCSLSALTALSLSTDSLRDAQALDALLRGFAYQAFTARPRTGVVYNGAVPSNLTGAKVSAMRLRSGSLRARGVTYEEFEVPKGVLEQPYVERLVLVYQNLGNWSMMYYPLQGYTYLAPVLGLLAYDASDLNARNLPALDIQASGQPITVRFPGLRPPPDGSVPKCVLFSLNGTINLSNVLSGNICLTFQEGHFSIVVKSVPAPAPSPVPPSPPPLPSVSPRASGGKASKDHNSNSHKVWIIVGSVVGGFALLVALAVIALWASKYKQGKKMHQMERAADVGEALHMTSVGNTKAPAATGTRTQPMLETEYVP